MWKTYISKMDFLKDLRDWRTYFTWFQNVPEVTIFKMVKIFEEHFIKGDIKIANQERKLYLTMLIIQEMQIKYKWAKPK